jgi:hypothetical protein
MRIGMLVEEVLNKESCNQAGRQPANELSKAQQPVKELTSAQEHGQACCHGKASSCCAHAACGKHVLDFNICLGGRVHDVTWGRTRE